MHKNCSNKIKSRELALALLNPPPPLPLQWTIVHTHKRVGVGHKWVGVGPVSPLMCTLLKQKQNYVNICLGD